jgi:hypothetical protein
LGTPGLDRLIEPCRRVRCNQGGLEDSDFVQINALPQAQGIVSGRVGKAFLHQPDTGDRVFLRHDNQRIETCLFETGGRQDCQIEARGELVLHDPLGKADLLPHAFEDRGWIAIANGAALQCRKHRAGDRQHARWTLGLVSR